MCIYYNTVAAKALFYDGAAGFSSGVFSNKTKISCITSDTLLRDNRNSLPLLWSYMRDFLTTYL